MKKIKIVEKNGEFEIEVQGRPVSIAEGIRAVRREFKLNTMGLGKIIYCSPRTVENWEQGRCKPSPQAMKIMELWLDQQD